MKALIAYIVTYLVAAAIFGTFLWDIATYAVSFISANAGTSSVPVLLRYCGKGGLGGWISIYAPTLVPLALVLWSYRTKRLEHSMLVVGPDDSGSHFASSASLIFRISSTPALIKYPLPVVA